jgi:hypothetical protein
VLNLETVGDQPMTYFSFMFAQIVKILLEKYEFSLCAWFHSAAGIHTNDAPHKIIYSLTDFFGFFLRVVMVSAQVEGP